MEKIVNCPFSKEKCSPDCGLYIKPEDLNETFRNKLASLGVFDRDKGICSLKNISLCMSRNIFESASGYFK